MSIACAVIILTGYVSFPIDYPVCKAVCFNSGVHIVVKPKRLGGVFCICNDKKEFWMDDFSEDEKNK